jgi:hypothetical protein
MSTPVLVAIILIAVGCGAALTRLRVADRRSVAAHHRALETMGRLVAQPPTREAPSTPEQHAGQAHVRVVSSPEPAGLPYVPPLRSRSRIRPRHLPEYRSWDEVAPAWDEVASVAAGPETVPEAAPTPEPEVAAAQGRPLLHFDALGATQRAEFSDAPFEESTPVRAPARRSFHRSGFDRRRVRRRPGGARRLLAAVAAAIIVLAGAGTAGVLVLRSDPSRASAPPHPPARGAPTTAPLPSTTTLPARTLPPSPVLVTSSAGYSEYRLSGPANILLSASGTCWVQIRQNGPTGQVLYEGDLHAGDTHGTPGSTWLRLGNPSQVTITVNGVTLSPPSLVAGQPYNLQFE